MDKKRKVMTGILIISVILNVYLAKKMLDYRGYVVDIGMRMQINSLKDHADAFAKLKIGPNAIIAGGQTIAYCKLYEISFISPEGLSNEFKEWMAKEGLEPIRVDGWPVNSKSNQFIEKDNIRFQVEYK